MTKKYSVGVDIGGTFTDFYVRDVDTAQVRLLKIPSTPHDPSEAIMRGFGEITADGSAQVVSLRHGTTVALNALLEGRGEKVAMITTSGFRDLVEIGRQVRPDMYDLQLDAPLPVADREYRFELDERTLGDGSVLRQPSAEDIDAVVAEVAASGVSACAICFLFSYVNAGNEQAVADAVVDSGADIQLSLSSEINPEFREYERFSTTILNAYVQPVMARYLRNLKEKVAASARELPIYVSQSSGGLMSLDRAKQFPIRTIFSGPAAGVVGAIEVSRRAGVPDFITFDMGGTSTDVCLVRRHAAEVAVNRKVSSYPVRMPMVDINTVGAGGGSVVWLDADGLPKVGPLSSGAMPGPACYGNGGQEATVTDANLLLGRLSPGGLLNGSMQLDVDAARRVFEPVAEALGISVEEAAHGVIDIVVSNMTRAVRSISVEKGYDARDFALMAFGGAGPLHAADLARSLGIRSVVIPPAPGILCAHGLQSSSLTDEFVITARIALDGEAAAQIDAVFGRLVDKAVGWFDEEKVAPALRSVTVAVDMRYVRQNFELRIVAVDGQSPASAVSAPDIDTMKARFFAEHEKSYGYFNPDDPIEIVNCRITATVNNEPAANSGEPTNARAVKRETRWRDVSFKRGAFIRTPIFARDDLEPGTRLDGPAIVEQLDSTFVLFPGDTVRVSRDLSMIMDLQS